MYMEIQYNQNLLASLKNKHLLLDTNVFRDFANKSSVFTLFFNNLKKADCTLATTDFIKYELLKGSATTNKYKEKEDLINQIVDVVIPITSQNFTLAYELIQQYGIEGTGVSVPDLFLGTLLKQYKTNIYLMSRDTTDFIQKIFTLSDIVNIPNAKGIYTYGIYQYK